MAREQSFLDRVAEGLGGGRGGPTTTEDIDLLAEAVRRNLAHLLNSRQGMSPAQSDYGLPSLTDVPLEGTNALAVLREKIRATIERYEPRLRRVRVSSPQDEEQPDRQKLVFRIDALLVGRSGEHTVRYQTGVEPTGEYEVAG
jgi:type VI secretion system protein